MILYSYFLQDGDSFFPSTYTCLYSHTPSVKIHRGITLKSETFTYTFRQKKFSKVSLSNHSCVLGLFLRESQRMLKLLHNCTHLTH